MSFSSLFVFLDDIASTLDDVAVMTKTAATKTMGVVGDDLAVNAEQVAGVTSNRELPVVGKVALGSLVNKAILIPLALLISYVAPWLITPLLICGGSYLCFEGFEKIHHQIKHRKHIKELKAKGLIEEGKEDEHAHSLKPKLTEKEKVMGAIRTDFILSAEIIVISLGVVADAPIMDKSITLIIIGFLMTLLVYGVVALIVKVDDIGLWLVNKGGAVKKAVGEAMVAVMPYILKSLTIIGTIAMFMVGGSIIVHGVGPLHHEVEHLAKLRLLFFPSLTQVVLQMLVGMVVGMAIFFVVAFIGKLRGKKGEVDDLRE